MAFDQAYLTQLETAIKELAADKEEIEIQDADGNRVQYQKKNLDDLIKLHKYVEGKVLTSSRSSSFTRIKHSRG